MANSSTTTTTAPPRINPSPPTSRGPISSARSDQNELIAQARQLLALKHELINRERQLLNACRRAEIPLEELYGHALR